MQVYVCVRECEPSNNVSFHPPFSRDSVHISLRVFIILLSCKYILLQTPNEIQNHTHTHTRLYRFKICPICYGNLAQQCNNCCWYLAFTLGTVFRMRENWMSSCSLLDGHTTFIQTYIHIIICSLADRQIKTHSSVSLTHTHNYLGNHCPINLFVLIIQAAYWTGAALTPTGGSNGWW